MAKIFFPFNDQPKQFPFIYDRTIRFPFVIEDLLYLWEVTSEGVTIYLHTADISSNHPILKDILLEESGINFYLDNSQAGLGTSLGKSIYVTFEQIGMGIHTLGLLDPLTLGDIDPYTLGEISTRSASWLALRNAITSIASNINSTGDDLHMRLDSDFTVTCEKSVFTGTLQDTLYITGLRSQRVVTLGELDPYPLTDIDLMFSMFRVFEDIPASLVKMIYVSSRSELHHVFSNNGLYSDIDIEASDARMAFAASDMNCLSDMNSYANGVALRLLESEEVEALQDVMLFALAKDFCMSAGLIEALKDVMLSAMTNNLYISTGLIEALKGVLIDAQSEENHLLVGGTSVTSADIDASTDEHAMELVIGGVKLNVQIDEGASE